MVRKFFLAVLAGLGLWLALWALSHLLTSDESRVRLTVNESIELLEGFHITSIMRYVDDNYKGPQTSNKGMLMMALSYVARRLHALDIEAEENITVTVNGETATVEIRFAARAKRSEKDPWMPLSQAMPATPRGNRIVLSLKEHPWYNRPRWKVTKAVMHQDPDPTD